MDSKGLVVAKILHTYVGERSSQDMTARQNTVTPTSVLPSGKKQYLVYATTIQNLCLRWLCNHNLCNVCVFTNGNNILKCVTTCHSKSDITIM